MPPIAVQACSLINAFDDVKPAVGDASTSGGDGGDTEAGGGDASGDGNVSTDAPVVDTGVDAGPEGLVVVAAFQAAGIVGDASVPARYVTSVLNAADGKELSREVLPIMGSIYDEGADLWYLFEAKVTDAPGSSGPSPDPYAGDSVFVRLRKLASDGKWTELSRVRVPVPTTTGGNFAAQAAALDNRLAYLAFAPDAATPASLVVLDTTDAGAFGDASVDASALLASELLSVAPLGITGSRLKSGNSDNVTLVQNKCVGTNCQFELFPMKLPHASLSIAPRAGGAVPVGKPYNSGTTPNQAIGAAAYTSPTELFAVPGSATDAGALLTSYSAVDTVALSSVPFATTSATPGQFRGLAVSTCLEAAFVAERIGNSIIAVPLKAGGTPLQIVASGTVTFEPYTSALLVESSGSVSAFTIAASGNGFSQTARPAFKMPSDLKAYQVATRQSLAFPPAKCPK